MPKINKCNLCDWVEDKDDDFDLSEHLIGEIETIDQHLHTLEIERQEAQDQLLAEVGEKAIGDLIHFKE